MGRHKSNWDKDGEVGKEKTAIKAESSAKKLESTTSVEVAEVTEAPTRKSIKTIETPTLQNLSAIDQKKLPQVIVIYEDKNNRRVTRVFTCYSLDIHESTQTKLSGLPTSRKDLVDLSLDAKVVHVE